MMGHPFRYLFCVFFISFSSILCFAQNEYKQIYENIDFCRYSQNLVPRSASNIDREIFKDGKVIYCNVLNEKKIVKDEFFYLTDSTFYNIQYYPSHNIKTEGVTKIAPRVTRPDTELVTDIITGLYDTTLIYLKPILKIGTWEEYRDIPYAEYRGIWKGDFLSNNKIGSWARTCSSYNMRDSLILEEINYSKDPDKIIYPTNIVRNLSLDELRSALLGRHQKNYWDGYIDTNAVYFRKCLIPSDNKYSCSDDFTEFQANEKLRIIKSNYECPSCKNEKGIWNIEIKNDKVFLKLENFTLKTITIYEVDYFDKKGNLFLIDHSVK